MGSHNPFDFDRNGNWVKNPVTIIDKLLGTTYDVVKFVAANMQYIRHVSHHMKAVYDLSQSQIAVSVVPVLIDTTATKTTVLPVKLESVRGFSVVLKKLDGSVISVPSNYFNIQASGTSLIVGVDPMIPILLLGSTAHVSVFYDWKLNEVTNV